MDNITHSLVGYAVAKTAKHINIKFLSDVFKNKKFSAFIIFASIFAANFPDLDLLYGLFDSSKLGYLVHHRGHTHTFILALPQAFIALFLSALIFRIKDKAALLIGLIFITINIGLHICLDALNIYGVHPFYPWNNEWYYGDRVFIVEPLIWFSLLPLALTPIKKIFSFKNIVIIFFLVTIVLAIYAKMMVLGTAVFLVLYFGALIWSFNYMLESTKSITAVSFTLIIVLGFIVEGFIVESKLTYQLSNKHVAKTSKFKLGDVDSVENHIVNFVDLAITPYPGNPFCWNVYATRILGQDEYQVAVGKYQSAKVLGFQCPEGMVDKAKNIDKVPEVKNMVWYQVYSGSKKQIFNDKGDCRLQNWFQFIRIPFINDTGEYVDLRFSNRSSARDFSSLDLQDKTQSCIKLPAPWVPPREDLF